MTTDYEKALGAAEDKIVEIFRKWESGPTVGGLTLRADKEAISAALAAFEAHGYVLVPKEASIGMIGAMANANARHGGCATPEQEYTAMITAAIKERT